MRQVSTKKLTSGREKECFTDWARARFCNGPWISPRCHRSSLTNGGNSPAGTWFKGNLQEGGRKAARKKKKKRRKEIDMVETQLKRTNEIEIKFNSSSMLFEFKFKFNFSQFLILQRCWTSIQFFAPRGIRVDLSTTSQIPKGIDKRDGRTTQGGKRERG